MPASCVAGVEHACCFPWLWGRRNEPCLVLPAKPIAKAISHPLLSLAVHPCLMRLSITRIFFKLSASFRVKDSAISHRDPSVSEGKGRGTDCFPGPKSRTALSRPEPLTSAV